MVKIAFRSSWAGAVSARGLFCTTIPASGEFLEMLKTGSGRTPLERENLESLPG